MVEGTVSARGVKQVLNAFNSGLSGMFMGVNIAKSDQKESDMVTRIEITRPIRR